MINPHAWPHGSYTFYGPGNVDGWSACTIVTYANPKSWVPPVCKVTINSGGTFFKVAMK